MLSRCFISIFAVLALTLYTIKCLSVFGRCINPNEEHGACIYLEQCHYLYDALHRTILSDSDRLFLTNSQCGFANGHVLICCPQRYIYYGESSTDLLPTSEQCAGVLSNRIYGGNITKIDEYPWMARIEYTKSRKRKGFHCGGSLINQRYVLTAAHCVSGSSIPSNWRLTGVRLGEWDTASNPDCETDLRGQKDCAPAHLDIAVSETITHENYIPKSRTQQHDIALLRLARAVTFTDFVRPICLPLKARLRNANLKDMVMNVAGWGQTEHGRSSNKKLKADVIIINLVQCQQVYSMQNINLEQTQICAGGKLGIDSCRGDSGGPLIALDTNNNEQHAYFLAGIVSFGPIPCGIEGWPGVYTRVTDYIQWIQYNIRP